MQNSTVFVLDKNENSREIIKSFIENLDFVNEVKLYDDFTRGYEDIKQSDNFGHFRRLCRAGRNCRKAETRYFQDNNYFC